MEAVERTQAQVVDPITVEVIGNAIFSISEEMGEALVRASYSDNIKERRDSSCAIFDAQGRTLAQAAHIPIHLGSLIGIVEAMVQRYPIDEMQDGDQFIANDAYVAGGTHLPDIMVAAPVFYDGKLVAFVANLGHHQDFLDRGPGHHIFQEGLRMPPIKILDRGRLREDIFEFILLNCQLPKERRGDFRAQFASNRLAARRLRELCDRYGVEMFYAVSEELLNYAERKTRAAISQIPSGTYEFVDYLDGPYWDDPLRMRLKLMVEGDHLRLDFTDNPPQQRCKWNMQWTAILATCYYGVKTVIDPTIPPNSGMYRAIEVVTKPGTIVHSVEPAAVESRTQTCQRVVDLIHGCLVQAVPERVTAAHNGANSGLGFYGNKPDTGEFFGYGESTGGGFGARASKDGLDGVQIHITNTSNLPIEALESTYPLQVEFYQLEQDSGGPGRFRGGMRFERRVKLRGGQARAYAEMTRGDVPPWGLFGGKPGALCQVGVTHPDGTVTETGSIGQQDAVELKVGEAIWIRTPGAGGYGDPHERSRALVIRDLQEEKISKESAIRDYGLSPREVEAALKESFQNLISSKR